ncbi:MAG TPA: FxsA family protein [Solirubrobacteraceae bacterium]|jgi:UPF0716 protein FxsA|nr:FxsA family protein [Solirubrobacteraceae bacterium]
MIWFVLLVLWPLAELFVIVKVSEAIGFLWVLLLLILSWPVGTRIIRLEGRAALRRLRDALAAGRAPTNEVLDGALVLGGGLLLLVPGFITDAIGLLLLLRPTRALARRFVARNHHSAWLNRIVSFITLGARGGRGGGPRGYDADTTAVDIDEPQLEA